MLLVRGSSTTTLNIGLLVKIGERRRREYKMKEEEEEKRDAL
jgi:hypothetical protein